MGTTKIHPLHEKADALKNAFILNGFSLIDDGLSPELLDSEWNLPSFHKPSHIRKTPILLEDGSYALRSELITSQLAHLKSDVPIKAAACGRIYDGSDPDYPCHTVIEGVVADSDMSDKDYARLWNNIVRQLYGLSARAVLSDAEEHSQKVEVETDNDRFVLAYTGPASVISRAILGIDTEAVRVWIFSIDIDAVAVHDYHLEDREALYRPVVSFLAEYASDRTSLTDNFARKAADLLRARGYSEFSGQKIYESDCYKKMNMIQESWDTNNRGVQLKTPLGTCTGLPTVLTPALEEALAENYKAGEENVRIFEIGHIFVPDPKGGKPVEKLALSAGVYGPDIDKVSFRKHVDSFLTELGIRNHFFIPTDLAIAYNTSDCWLILDEKMSYLEGNFGSISPKALQNHEIGTPAYMIQLELAPLEKKAEEEYTFVPTELL